MTDEILEKIERRQKKADKSQYTTQLFQEISTMKEFGLSPTAWGSLTGIDRKTLHYHRIMECHYIDEIEEKREREMKMEEQRRKMMSNMPKQMPRRRGR